MTVVRTRAQPKYYKRVSEREREGERQMERGGIHNIVGLRVILCVWLRYSLMGYDGKEKRAESGWKKYKSAASCVVRPPTCLLYLIN